MALHLHRAEGRRRATRLLFLVHNYGGSEHALATVGALLVWPLARTERRGTPA